MATYLTRGDVDKIVDVTYVRDLLQHFPARLVLVVHLLKYSPRVLAHLLERDGDAEDVAEISAAAQKLSPTGWRCSNTQARWNTRSRASRARSCVSGRRSNRCVW